MAGNLRLGWETAAVAKPSGVRNSARRPGLPNQRRRIHESAPRVGCKSSGLGFRRVLWRIPAAEEVAESAVAEEAEKGPTDNGESEGVEKDSPDDKVSNEYTARLDVITGQLLRTVEEGTLNPEGMKMATEDLQCLIKDMSGDFASLEEKASSDGNQMKETQDKYMRLSADFDNFRKRSATEKGQLKETVTSDVILKLLPIIDNFELARSQVTPANEGEEKINNSYQGLYKQMVDAFKDFGVEPVEGAGALFNPEVHEAIMREPNDDVPDGTVLEEFRKGFLLKGKLIRAAMVKVSHSDVQPAAESEPESEGADESGSDSQKEGGKSEGGE